jgi:SAM-dependent methyltransferase
MSYSYFSGVYDSLTENVDYEKIANVICSLLRKYGVNEGLLLDNACGTGTLSVLLSRAGYDVIGADKSSEMLSVAVKKAADANCRILFLNQDMLSLDLYGTIKACVCTLDGINHLDGIDEVKTAFEKIALFTEAGGIFIFDVNTDAFYEHIGEDTIAENREHASFIWENDYDPDSRENIYRMTFFVEEEDGRYRKVTKEHLHRAWSLPELRELIEEAGLQFESASDADTHLAPDEETERLLIIAKEIRKEAKSC